MILNKFEKEEELKKYLKEIFDYCMQYKWDTLKLKQLGKYLNIEGITVNELGKMSVEYQELSEEARKRLYEDISNFEKISKEKYGEMPLTNPILLQQGIITYQKWHNDQEKEIVLKTVYDYSMEVEYSREKLEQLANSLGVTYYSLTKDITEYATNYLGIDKEAWKTKKKQFVKKEKTNNQKRILTQDQINSLKKIYEYCDKFEYDKEAIEKLASKLDVTPTTIIGYAKTYATNCLELTTEEFYEHKKTFKKKKQAIKHAEKDKEVRLIARLMRTEETKKEYLKYVYDYCESVKYKKSELTKLATKLEVTEATLILHAEKYAIEYLQLTKEEWKQNRKDYRTDRAITKKRAEQSHRVKKLWKTKEEQEIILKEIYEKCESNNYSNEIALELSKKYNIKEKSVFNLARRYAIEYLKISKEEYLNRKKDAAKEKLKEYNKVKVKSRSIIYNKLLNANDFAEIINILETSGFDPIYLRSEIDNHVRLYDDIEDVTKLKKIFEMYHTYINELKREEKEEKKQKEFDEKTHNARELINKFIISNYLTINNFCKSENIDRSTFRYMKNIVKEKDQELYNMYIHKTEQNKEIILKQLEKIIYELNNGIKESNMTREFDLVDYYLITDIPLNEMLNYTRENKEIANLESFLSFRKFAAKNVKGEQHKEREIEKLINENIETDFKLDEHGRPIPGTGKSLSKETKIKIINYLKNNNIPINSITYSLMIKRYRLGLLELIVNKVLTKKIK